MRPATTTTLARARWSIQQSAATSSSAYGRAAAYRRISTTILASRSATLSSSNTQPSPLPFLRSEFLPRDILLRTSSAHARHFSSQPALHEQAQRQKNVKDAEPAPQPKAKQPPTEGSTTEQAADEQAKDEGEAKEKKAGEEETGEQKEGEEGQKKEKKDAPAPPPHGDKTPWQVFTETLQQEFQASKEWNEGTKELSGSIHDFTQNPQVQKAKQLSDEAKTKTAQALNATGRAVGQGAAWTWDTMPVKGVRAAARVTGTGLEYATRPVRQTKAFQAISETIDDGSSSRYGGWTEKEERRKRRELRELNELQRVGGKPSGPMEENPEYVNISPHSIPDPKLTISGPAQTSPSTKTPNTKKSGANGKTAPSSPKAFSA
jgi:import inner membrane translocase subunit TIM44